MADYLKLLVAAGLCVGSACCQADIDPASFVRQIGPLGNAIYGAGSSSQVYPYEAASASNSAIGPTAASATAITLSADSPVGEYIYSADSSVTYYFDIVSPTGVSSDVDANITAHAKTSASGGALDSFGKAGATAIAGLSIDGLGGPGTKSYAFCATTNSANCANAAAAPSGSVFDVSDRFALTSDVKYRVLLDASTTVDSANGRPGAAEAFVDPVISLSPEALRAGYVLEMSADITQAAVAPVPEPATCVLMSMGLLAMAGFVRRWKA